MPTFPAIPEGSTAARTRLNDLSGWAEAPVSDTPARNDVSDKLATMEAVDRDIRERIAVIDPGRPASNLLAYSTALVGPPAGRAPLALGTIVASADLGQVLRISGADIDPETGYVEIGPRAAFPIEAGRLYQMRSVIRRATDPSDPEGDAVTIRAHNLNQDYTQISSAQIGPAYTPTVDGPLVEIVTTVALGTVGDVAPGYVLPAGTRHFTPGMRVYGVGHALDIAVLFEWSDVTNVTLGGADVAGLTAGLNSLNSDYQAVKPDILDSAAQVADAKGAKDTINARLEADRLTDARRGQRGPHFENTLRNWSAGRKTFAKQLVNRLVSFMIAPTSFRNREKIDEVWSELSALYAGGLLYKLSGAALWDRSGRHILARIDRLGRTLVTGAGRLGAPVVHSLETPRWYATSPGTSLTGARTRALVNDANAIAYFPAKGQSFLFGGAAADMGTAVFSAGAIAAGKALMPKQTTGKRIWVDSDSVFTEFEDMAGGTGYENPPGTRILGESPIYEMVRHWLAACQTHFGYQPQTLATIAGAGGQTLMQMCPGTQNWIEWESGIVQSRDAARRLKKRLWIVAIPLVFGQSMFNYASSYPDLKQAVFRYGLALQNRAMYLTGEYEHRPPVLVAPVTRAIANTASAPYPRPELASWNRAVQELCEEHPWLFVNYGAGYGDLLASDEHRTITGYRQEGKRLGIAAENAVLSTGHSDFRITDVLRTGATTLRALLYTGDGAAPLIDPPGTETGGVGNPSSSGDANYIGPATGKYARCCGFQAADATDPSTTNEDFIGVEDVVLGSGTYEGRPYLDITLSRAPLGSTGVLLVAAQGQTTSIQGTNDDTARTNIRTGTAITIDNGSGGTITQFKYLSPGRFRIPAL